VTRPSVPRSRRRGELAAFLVATGACSLVYEVTWARELILYLGNTSLSHAAVLTTFMAGQGVGYVCLGRRAAASDCPLRMYAWLEAGIVVLAVATRFVLPHVGELVNAVVPADSSASMAARGVLAGLVLLPATILMGGTLPALVRAIGRDDDSASVARLYAANSCGAVLGCLASGYVLLGWLGLDATAAAAWTLNAIVAVAAWLRSGSADPRPSQLIAPERTPGDTNTSTARPRFGLLLAVAIVGAASMTIQTASLRLFGVVMGSSTYSFSAVVAAFILAIVVGSERARSRIESTSTQWDPVVASAGAGLALLVIAHFGERAPWILAHMRTSLGDSFGDWMLFEAAKLGLVIMALFVPVAGAAAFLPLAIAKLVDDGQPNASAAAKTLAFNTVGASLGAALGGTVLLPHVGLDGAFTASGVLLGVAAIAAAIDARSTGGSAQLIPRPVIGIVAAVLLVAFIAPPTWDHRVLSATAFRWRKDTVPSWQRFERSLKRDELRFAADGPDATAIVTARDGGLTLKVNGKPDASTHGDMLTQVASAHVPLLLASNRKRVLVIGLGSGVTAGSAALHGARVDVVEISRAVADAARFFGSANREALDDPNIHLHIDDARAWLSRRTDRYDVIISEPSNPWVAGNAALFTEEFFELARSRLTPGGVLAQWFHAYEMTDELLLSVIGTAHSVFDDLRIFVLHQGDVLSIARNVDGIADSARLFRRVDGRFSAPIAADLARVDVPDLAALLSLEAIPATTAAAVIPKASPPLTDRHPVLEFKAPRALFAGHQATAINRSDARQWPPAGTGLLIEHLHAIRPVKTSQLRAIYKLHTRFRGAPPRFRRSLVPHLLATAGDPFAVDLLFTLVRERHYQQAQKVAEHVAAKRPDDPRALYARALLQFADGRPSVAKMLLKRCAVLGDTNGRCARKIAAR